MSDSSVEGCPQEQRGLSKEQSRAGNQLQSFLKSEAAFESRLCAPSYLSKNFKHGINNYSIDMRMSVKNQHLKYSGWQELFDCESFFPEFVKGTFSNIVYVFGAPGSGKSTMVKCFLKQYSAQSDFKIDFVFFLQCHQIDYNATCNLLQMLAPTFPFHWICDKNICGQVLTEISIFKEVLVIIDGLHNVPNLTKLNIDKVRLDCDNTPGSFLKNILHQEIFPKSKVLVTTRPFPFYGFVSTLSTYATFNVHSNARCLRELSSDIGGKFTSHISKFFDMHRFLSNYCSVFDNACAVIHVTKAFLTHYKDVDTAPLNLSITRVVLASYIVQLRSKNLRPQERVLLDIAKLAWDHANSEPYQNLEEQNISGHVQRDVIAMFLDYSDSYVTKLNSAPFSKLWLHVLAALYCIFSMNISDWKKFLSDIFGNFSNNSKWFIAVHLWALCDGVTQRYVKKLFPSSSVSNEKLASLKDCLLKHINTPEKTFAASCFDYCLVHSMQDKELVAVCASQFGDETVRISVDTDLDESCSAGLHYVLEARKTPLLLEIDAQKRCDWLLRVVLNHPIVQTEKFKAIERRITRDEAYCLAQSLRVDSKLHSPSLKESDSSKAEKHQTKTDAMPICNCGQIHLENCGVWDFDEVKSLVTEFLKCESQIGKLLYGPQSKKLGKNELIVVGENDKFIEELIFCCNEDHGAEDLVYIVKKFSKHIKKLVLVNTSISRLELKKCIPYVGTLCLDHSRFIGVDTKSMVYEMKIFFLEIKRRSFPIALELIGFYGKLSFRPQPLYFPFRYDFQWIFDYDVEKEEWKRLLSGKIAAAKASLNQLKIEEVRTESHLRQVSHKHFSEKELYPAEVLQQPSSIESSRRRQASSPISSEPITEKKFGAPVRSREETDFVSALRKLRLLREEIAVTEASLKQLMKEEVRTESHLRQENPSLTSQRQVSLAPFSEKELYPAEVLQQPRSTKSSRKRQASSPISSEPITEKEFGAPVRPREETDSVTALRKSVEGLTMFSDYIAVTPPYAVEPIKQVSPTKHIHGRYGLQEKTSTFSLQKKMLPVSPGQSVPEGKVHPFYPIFKGDIKPTYLRHNLLHDESF